MSRYDVAKVEEAARAIRWNIVQMVGPNQKGHLGGSLSLADVVAALFFSKMRHDPKNPHWPDRDRFILSKGHVALVQYAALAECGYFSKREFLKFKTLGGILQGHPDLNRTPGVEANTGSLGHGLSIACGMAAGLRMEGRNSRVYCALGDGEIAEGQVWEAALAATHYKLDNVIAILDRNCLQATGPIATRFNTNPIVEKWQSFGWHAVEVDGNDVSAVLQALDDFDEITGKPKILIACTVKGAGLPFAENNVAFHNGSMTTEQFETARRLLGAAALV